MGDSPDRRTDPVTPSAARLPGAGVAVLDPADATAAPTSSGGQISQDRAKGRIRRLARRLSRFAYDLLTEVP